ncbi:HPr family phosphocarrier protein [Paenibacillus xerothermodurans]|uniref:HPr family phosphocarrier protein n=1 Tax=Paenibacillus xerothermodurans TaxID=1977292 RepID=A0A2W1NAY0_PAEXE|nr:HPr family phosphocarrier protein [Paenibacillus xerothermodurans]PZE21084.1 HPr family phosphocarrier protein [Paenibacillus xerothermodurans]
MLSHTETMVRIVQEANEFQSSIVLKYNNKFIDAKSLLGLYTTMSDSEEYELHVNGTDAAEATKAMVQVFEKYGLRVKVAAS